MMKLLRKLLFVFVSLIPCSGALADYDFVTYGTLHAEPEGVEVNSGNMQNFVFKYGIGITGMAYIPGNQRSVAKQTPVFYFSTIEDTPGIYPVEEQRPYKPAGPYLILKDKAAAERFKTDFMSLYPKATGFNVTFDLYVDSPSGIKYRLAVKYMDKVKVGTSKDTVVINDYFINSNQAK